MSDPVLELKDVRVSFDSRKGPVEAVRGISLTLNRGEITAIVGESGCGKSVTSQAVMGLVGRKKNEHVSGEILFHNDNLLTLSERDMRKLRGKELAMIFQDPMTSLNPVYKIGAQIAEMPIIHEKASSKSAWGKAIDMLKKVGIPSAEERAKQYPHQFSGGMRQRAVIAMSMTLTPDVLIADEPTTALDVTIQAQILDLIRSLSEDTNTAILFITHDLGVVAELCDNVAVMYAGEIVEQTSVENLFENPRHPYTKGLLASLPIPGQQTRLTPIAGQPPNLHDLPAGCAFAERCPFAMDRCRIERPELKEYQSSHRISCWLEEESL